MGKFLYDPGGVALTSGLPAHEVLGALRDVAPLARVHLRAADREGAPRFERRVTPLGP